MYVLFENHKDANGKTVATDVVCSSYKTSIFINWKKDKTQFDVMRNLLKSPPLNMRTYNEELKMWSYLGEHGANLLKILQEAFKQLNQHMEFVEIEDLENAIRSGSLGNRKQTTIDPSTFFYNKVATGSIELTKESAALKLVPLLDCGAIENISKKFYLLAVKKYHPDFGGDAKVMSELNMLWQVYNA